MYDAKFDLCLWHKMDTRAILVVQQVCKELKRIICITPKHA